MTCRHCVDAGDFFGSRLARHELKRYRRRGPSRTTRLLLDAVLSATDGWARGLDHEEAGAVTLLDIGGGVGALQHELVRAGAASVLAVDASTAYLGASGQEARRLGQAHRYDFRAGDAVELAPGLPRARIVTLDRVLCCYPDMPALVGASAERARRLWGVVFPRDRWYVRLGVALINLYQALRGREFRVYLHRPDRIGREAEKRGLRLVARADTPVWQVQLWERAGASPGQVPPRAVPPPAG